MALLSHNFMTAKGKSEPLAGRNCMETPPQSILSDSPISLLLWARASPEGHPAMRVVQALYWLRDLLPTNKDQIFKRLLTILRDPTHGRAIQDNLRNGLSTLPEWLQEVV